jgi:hypothetical protein
MRRWRIWLRGRRTWLALLVALLIVLGGLWGATRPRVANHFGYALPGADGLPSYVYANGRRYESLQVCAYADWCAVDRTQQGIPRCYTQADLSGSGRFRAWPLTHAATMYTLFGAPHDILIPDGSAGLTTLYIVEDGPDCYVTYTLEGGT